jgi:hypothetical protein
MTAAPPPTIAPTPLTAPSITFTSKPRHSPSVEITLIGWTIAAS